MINTTKKMAGCVYCDCDLVGQVPTLDHVLACELGGTNHESNLVTCCLSCNSSKRDLPLNDFLRVLADRGIDRTTVMRFVRLLIVKPHFGGKKSEVWND